MKTFRGTLPGILVLVAALLGLTPAPAAHADDSPPSSWHVSRYEQDATVQTNGDALVTTTIDFDFSDDAGHGPYLTFPLRQAIANDPDHWRAIDISDVQVASPSGAPASIDEQDEKGGALLLKIGNSRKTVKGVQTYVVHYRIHGLVDPHNAQSHLDEVNWNPVGDGWTVPLQNITVTLDLPAMAGRVACFTPQGSCTSNATPGRTVTFHQDRLAKGKYLQVVAGMPQGTFVGAEPRLIHRNNLAHALRPTGVNLVAGAGLALLGAAALFARVRRHGGDQAWAGVTPGLTPTGSGAGTTAADRHAPVAVAFTPPAGTTPGEVGTLLTEKAESRDVSATIIDLAVRGYLRITQLDEGGVRFERLTGTDDQALQPQEVSVLGSMFPKKKQVTSGELRNAKYGKMLPDAKKALYRQVVDKRHWFVTNPQDARGTWLGMGALLFCVGVGLVSLGLLWNLSLPGVVLMALGVAIVVLHRHAVRRTADGSAVLAQARGFELYLTTAEADQLRFEEGEDIFSRYLPWAIAFGVAERWTELFEKLAAEGRYDMRNDWYVGHSMGYGYYYGSLGDIGTTLSSSMQASVSAASSSSSSGGSGFSGGGGFGGGGGGGW